MVKRELTILWNGSVWGVYDECTCPTRTPIPTRYYKVYEVEDNQTRNVFAHLLKLREKLVIAGTVPTLDNYSAIFPNLDNLLNNTKEKGY